MGNFIFNIHKHKTRESHASELFKVAPVLLTVALI
jgi:hypothetical protein